MCGAATTLCAKYNDLESVRAVFKENKGEIAGIILEPVVGNSGFIAPTQEFLEVLGQCHCMGTRAGCALFEFLSGFYTGVRSPLVSCCVVSAEMSDLGCLKM